MLGISIKLYGFQKYVNMLLKSEHKTKYSTILTTLTTSLKLAKYLLGLLAISLSTGIDLANTI